MSAILPEGTGSETALPVLKRENFNQTAAYLAPDVVATYLRTIGERCDTLKRELLAAAHPDAKLGEAAHALAGSAGLFGFERVAAAGRMFERSILAKGDDLPILTAQLVEALEDTLRVICETTLVQAA